MCPRTRPPVRTAVVALLIVGCVACAGPGPSIEARPDSGQHGVAEEEVAAAWEDLSVPVPLEELPAGRPRPFSFTPEKDSVEWEIVTSRSHALLRDGVEIVTWQMKNIIPSSERHVVREGAKSYQIRGPQGLRTFLREIRTGEDALAYFHLLRLLLLPEESVAQRLGKILSPHENPLSMIGEYGPSKAALWGIPFPPAAFVKDGAFHIRHPVLNMEQQVVTRPDDPEDPKVWRVILVEERIERDGVYSLGVLRVLDSDGSRYRIDRL